MNRIFIGLIAVVSIFGLLSCENANTLDPQSGDIGNYSLDRRGHHGHDDQEPCAAVGEFAEYNESDSHYAVYDYILWAEEDSDVGEVSITNDGANIYVTYTTDESVELDAVHINVWTNTDEIPSQAPSAHDADYSQEDIGASSTTVVIPVDFPCGNSYYISAQASLNPMNDDEDDDHGNGHGHGHHEGHGHDRGRGHHHHGNGNGYGHDDDDMIAYAGDADSPACFAGGHDSFWGYVNYLAECNAAVSGLVYNDANTSGNFDSGETGFENILVTAIDGEGNLYTTLSGVDGTYLFEHLPTGVDYTVMSDMPVGDFEAAENATSYIITDLMADVGDVNFGFSSAILLSECGVEFPIWANENVNAGTLSIENDADNIYVTFATNNMGDLAEVHVNIGSTNLRNIEDPATYNANQFVDVSSLPVDVMTVTIPFSATDYTCADLFIVKAHAVLTTDAASGSAGLDGATAFGGETFYPAGRSPWFYDTAYYSCCPVAGPQ